MPHFQNAEGLYIHMHVKTHLNSLRVENLTLLAGNLLPASLLLGYMSSDWRFQDPVWNLFVSLVVRIYIQVLCFKPSQTKSVVVTNEMGQHFQQAENSPKTSFLH